MKRVQVAATMAESQRKNESAAVVSNEDAQAAHDRNTLLFFLFAGIAVVAGMFWIAGFLSGGNGGNALNPPLYVMAVCGAIGAVFYFLTRKTA
ncbi:MAG: hypothetical protein ACPHID_00590 [Thermoplasmatota archaeon]